MDVKRYPGRAHHTYTSDHNRNVIWKSPFIHALTAPELASSPYVRSPCCFVLTTSDWPNIAPSDSVITCVACWAAILRQGALVQHG
jgi:hypothetical protein